MVMAALGGYGKSLKSGSLADVSPLGMAIIKELNGTTEVKIIHLTKQGVVPDDSTVL